ncbi:hypothetical protein KCMC57_up53230 [Kitasatospora sp. CMC57]|uniref:Uncharacterized protein n=1 Tax=Kitasatospora sp. CMC57 TaxID=3231513 RepID=A0AB33K0C9_9ACTN
MVGVDRVGHQRLGVQQDVLRGAAVVQPGGGEHVGPEQRVAERLPDAWIGAPALLVAGRGEREAALLVVGGERFQHGCA